MVDFYKRLLGRSAVSHKRQELPQRIFILNAPLSPDIQCSWPDFLLSPPLHSERTSSAVRKLQLRDPVPSISLFPLVRFLSSNYRFILFNFSSSSILAIKYALIFLQFFHVMHDFSSSKLREKLVNFKKLVNIFSPLCLLVSHIAALLLFSSPSLSIQRL